MDTKELKKYKASAESKIAEIAAKFEADTGLSLVHINLEREPSQDPNKLNEVKSASLQIQI